MKKSLALQLVAIVTISYFAICIWIYSSLQQKQIFHKFENIEIDVPYLDINKPCFIGPEPKYQIKGKSSWSLVEKWHRPSIDMCYVGEDPLDSAVDIQLEKEWDNIDVNFPQFIMTVSGWIQVVTVNKWEVRPIKVIIVPHSHQDPGWLYTFQHYYNIYTKSTLDNMVDKLSGHPQWRFIWSEVIFLSKWWSKTSFVQRQKFKRLLKRGQLEIVTGGWVMTDEGTAHYMAMLDQLIEGHQWLKHNLRITPNVSWSVDPFGHSPTMAYLLKKSDQRAMIIQRIHYAIKKHFAKEKNFEFRWRQVWDKSGNTDILTHMMPFLSYSILYSCGPDPHVCCQFDFNAKKCFRGKKTVDVVEINDENVEKISWGLWEQLQKKATLYRSDTILVPHGDDFRYHSSEEWDKQLPNMEKLMKYINSNPTMKTQIKFGTLTEYINEVTSKIEIDKFPSFSGDFFTYNDRDDQYWSGYFTSRPHYKYMARRLQDLLRSLEILYTLNMAQALKHRELKLMATILKYKAELVAARQNLGLYQHHDAITGTARQDAVNDYGSRMLTSYKSLSNLLGLLTQISLTSEQQHKDITVDNIQVEMNEEWENHNSLLSRNVIKIDVSRKIIFYNSLGHRRQEVVHLHVDRFIVKVIDEQSGKEVVHQISPVWDNDHSLKTNAYELSFEVEIPPVSMVTYLVESLDIKKVETTSISNISIIRDKKELQQTFRSLQFRIMKGDDLPTFRISNPHMIATFYTCNGKLQYIRRKLDDVTLRSEVKFMTYGTGSWINPFRDKSGAYTFQPDGPAKMLPELDSSIYVISGPVYSKVVTIHPYVLHEVVLYNVTGSMGAGVYINNVADIRSDDFNNKELIMRIDSGIQENSYLCTDMNGFQMHRKKYRKKFTIQGNFYPMTSMASIESNNERLTLLTSSTHGVASLSPGWLEVVLDRRLMQDDWRGLNEGVKDNIPTKSRFILLFEARDSPIAQVSSPICFPSPLAAILSRMLENQIKHLLLVEKKNLVVLDYKMKSYALSLPCDTSLINLRYIESSNNSVEALWILHRLSVDCGFIYTYYQCQENVKVIPNRIWSGVEITKLAEMTMTGVKLKKYLSKDSSLDIPPMEINTYKLTFS